MIGIEGNYKTKQTNAKLSLYWIAVLFIIIQFDLCYIKILLKHDTH